jgi:hypothetical protein
MLAYGILTNLPFIIVQRYNRPRIAAMYRRLSRYGRSSSS